MYLTQSEAENLLNAIKTGLDKFINLPTKGNKINLIVKSEKPNMSFNIQIYQSRTGTKININALINKSQTGLLFLHINPTNIHINPDNEKIIGSHWHIYKEGYDTKYAYPATDINDKDFITNTLIFFRKFNIIDKPNITYQNTLF